MGVTLESFLYCPHHPDGPVREYAVRCECRKPPGMIQNAASSSRRSHAPWMVGDILDDVEAGRRAGCRTILIDNGHENEWCLDDLRRPHHVAPDLSAAAHIIRANSEEQKRFLAEVRGMTGQWQHARRILAVRLDAGRRAHDGAGHPRFGRRLRAA